MVQQIIEGFGLDEDAVVSLGTSGIDVCEGKEVKIHESAYTFIWGFLDKVNVTIVDRAPGKLISCFFQPLEFPTYVSTVNEPISWSTATETSTKNTSLCVFKCPGFLPRFHC